MNPKVISAGRRQTDLIFDIGMHDGEDTEFYLAKGFRVVGVEPNPSLVKRLKVKFASEIASGHLRLEAVGVMNQSGKLPFYLNRTNSLWSSFVKEYGCRRKTKYDVLEIECLTIDNLVYKHGCPYYIKFNTEGADSIIVDRFKFLYEKPDFISMGDFETTTIDYLFRLGYNIFSLRAQNNKAWAELPYPAREGRYVPRRFTPLDSGPFGFEVPQWMSAATAKLKFLQTLRDKEESAARTPESPAEWYDLHATSWPRSIDGPKLQLLA